jgi:hypothetical protein
MIFFLARFGHGGLNDEKWTVLAPLSKPVLAKSRGSRSSKTKELGQADLEQEGVET